jgi:uncharacterized protein with NRDE domain
LVCPRALAVGWNPGTRSPAERTDYPRKRPGARKCLERAGGPRGCPGAYHGGMCIVAFHWRPGPRPSLVLAGNRDEFYDRPTAPLAWWPGGRVLAGRDLQAGGTWLGVSRAGHCALLTNHRDPRLTRSDRPTRGQLPVRFLEEGRSARDFLEALQPEASRYNPFNLLLFDGRDLLGYESLGRRLVTFEAGLHGVSNGTFDEPWPKVQRLKAGFLGAAPDDEALLTLLGDSRPFEDPALPATGVPMDWERALSPVFVRTPTYGTRTTTILRLEGGTVSLVEQPHEPQGENRRRAFRFEVPGGT